ncbi:MAG: L-glutamate gamma-semialdehyde dehydrogenase [Chitinophagales bacterium]|nr:L-glutamate gamma-semialdehyde dehydrogenase [Chitinophagales bacterium]MDW8392916.1 L-glutamate gamma-semialdehyde dehydrogenase [Chitinophagales bacterium]
MSAGFFQVPLPSNEPVYSYGPGTPERRQLQETLRHLKQQQWDIPMFIGGREVRTGQLQPIHPPHERNHLLGHFHKGSSEHIHQAIAAALAAKKAWEHLGWEDRLAIFLKAAELLSGPYRPLINAATMLCQSKNVFQAEIDAACELTDFWRFNTRFAHELYAQQPISVKGVWNRTEQRPLEGFVVAITPFNFTSIAGNLPTAPAMLGNTVVWKPANTQVYSAWVIMQVLREAGLPDGVINLIYADGSETGKVCFSHPDFAGIHFTGSTGVFQSMWSTIGANISRYKSYPRIVGETGGKDFVIAHASADVPALATALSRGAFEYQGQKCSAASRAYLPSNLWPQVRKLLQEQVNSFSIGSPEDFRNFFNAVIDQASFNKLAAAIDRAKADGAEFITGGTYDSTTGYFISPTTFRVDDPKYITMCEELFGPVLTIFVYDENRYEETLTLVDQTSPYGLTGAVFAQDRSAIRLATERLRHAAGNFYINDKPTGAVVAQQPFGGSRASGTNDKAGSPINLLRWLSPRSIKETFVPPRDYRYPFMEP